MSVLTPAPAVPDRSDPATFADRADAFVSWWAQLVADINGGALDLSAIGTPSLPSVRAADDPNTGLNFLGGDQLQLVTGGVVRVFMGTAAFQLNVPMTGTAVTQSATDTTAGRLLKAGDGGLLGLAPAVSASNALNSLTAGNQRVRVLTANVATVGGPSGAQGGVVDQHYFGPDNIGQIYTEVVGSSPRQWYRIYVSSAWTTWRQIYNQATVVGTVSQSDSVPTGALIERGSNANGTYVRFADGTQICWITISASALTRADVGVGNIFRSNEVTWTLPVAFTNTDFTATANAVSTGALWGRARRSGTAAVNYEVLSATSALSGVAVELSAIGRWY